MAIQAPVEELFDCVAADWERSFALRVPDALDWSPLGRSRLGPGFRVQCTGQPLGLRGAVELEVVELEPNRGWVAISTLGPRLVWRVRTRPANGSGSRLNYRLEVQGTGVRRLVDRLFGARRRAATIASLLEQLKARAEREEVLRRLRARASGPEE